MSLISISTRGSFANTTAFINRMLHGDIFSSLDRFGAAGVEALSRATPVDTGLTAQSWEYRIVKTRGRHTVEWYNTNIHNGSQVAILIQYGHGTGTGGFVQGRDYINPAIRPIFDQLADDVWKKVTA